MADGAQADSTSRVRNAAAALADAMRRIEQAQARLAEAVGDGRACGLSERDIAAAIQEATRGRPDRARALTSYVESLRAADADRKGGRAEGGDG